MSEFEHEYGLLQEQLSDPAAGLAARERIVEMITPLVRTYMWERHGSVLRGVDAAHDAESDGVVAVLGMLDSFDPTVGTLYHYLTARNAAWRRAVDASARHTDHAVKFSDGERRVLALAYKIKNEYLSARPHEHLDHAEWVELVRAHLHDEESSDEDKSAYNTRKGITAAARNLPELLAANQTPLHPDQDPQMWNLVGGVHEDVRGESELFSLCGVDSEDLTSAQARKAATRLGSGHGQFAYLGEVHLTPA